LVEVCPWNLIQYSEDFSNGVWAQYNGATITTDTIVAPNGTTTADTFEKTGGSGGINYYYIVTQTNTFAQLTNFFYVKYKSGSGIVWLLGLNSGTFAYYDIVNGTTLSKSSGMTTSIESVGNGWYKCIFSQDYGGASSTTFGIGVCLADGTPNYDATSAATQSVYIWGAQCNIGSTAKPYFPTTDRLNVPRLTYQNGGGGCPSLLLEKQSTNLALWSEDFSNAVWTQYQGGTITANSTISPDGTQNADTLTVASGQTYSGIYQSVSSSSDVYTLSIFAKYNTKRWLFFFDASASAQGWFDIQNGVLGTIPIGHTGTIENFGNGWYRCTFKKNTAVTPAFFQIGLVDADGFSAPTSNGSSYIWGAQFE
jgi:hypothetical protein